MVNTLKGQDIPYMDGTLSYEKKADSYYDQMAYTKAEKSYKKALVKSPGSPELNLKLARCYTQLNDMQNAKKHYGNAINSDNATTADVLNYADALASSGDYENAAKWYEKYKKDHPGESRVNYKLEGIQQLNKFYEDTGIYEVEPVDFNSENTDFATAFYDEQTWFVSNREKAGLFQVIDGRDENAFLDIYYIEEGKISKFETKNKLHKGSITFFDSGNRALITVSQTGNGGFLKRSDVVKLKIMIYKKTSNGWQYESDFPYNSSDYSIGYPSYDEKNQILYFAGDIPGGKGGADIYTSVFENGNWSIPKNLSNINTEGDEIFPFISDNDELYFTSNGRGGLGGLDIYKTNVDQVKNNIINLKAPVNTPADDFGLILDNTRKNGYINSNRANGMGSDDIYKLIVNGTRVQFRLVDKITGDSLEGKFTITDEKTGDKISFMLIDNNAVLDAVADRNYIVVGEKEGYIKSEVDFNRTENPEELVDIPMTKNELITRVRINNLTEKLFYEITKNGFTTLEDNNLESSSMNVEINNAYFSFDEDKIESTIELDKIAKLLLQFENLNLKIIAYCDTFGSNNYNDKLAERRANEVRGYLVEKGIESERIQKKAIGKRKLFNNCGQNQKCSDKEHQENRRVEFVLIDNVK